MTHSFTIAPAHAEKPGVHAHGNSAVFAAVFRGDVEHGLQFIHLPDGETFYIPLTDQYRVGSVYSVRITPFEAAEWAYRYRSGAQWVADPNATGVCSVQVREDAAGETCRAAACICSPLRAGDLFEGAPEKPLEPADWKEQTVYSLHVKGLTAAQPEGFPGRGTFAGVAAMIPYLESLGMTAVELMPVYLPLPDLHRTRTFRTMQEALGAWPVGPQGDPLRDMKERPNYWGYGRGLYKALRPEFGSQQEFAQMVHALHRAGIRVLLQIYFERGMQPAQQIDILRFYVERYGIDGFRLMGHLPSPSAIASAPSLSDTTLLYRDFPFEDLRSDMEAEEVLYGDALDTLCPGRDASAPSASSGSSARAPVRFPNLITCADDFQTLLRRFVKSDDYVMKDFLKLFLAVPAEHGQLRAVTSYEGFTLADLVSYSERHNEANGEFGLDGREDNHSWNCGEEGETDNETVLALRRRQVRNFLTLLFLAQGTPMLRHGDERGNSQQGNNNPYCQDNEISWIDWTDSPACRQLTRLTAGLIAFRADHPVFHTSRPFQYIDTLGIGHPDVSLHGEEAWKPDLGPFSHSIGIAFCENYAGRSVRRDLPPAFVYLAVNMYWKELSLALPKLPPGYVWKVFMDTETEDGFLEKPLLPKDQHFVSVGPRSIRILRSVPDQEAILHAHREELQQTLPCAGACRRAEKKKNHSGSASCARRLFGRTPHARRRIRHLCGPRG
ncbi:MAG: alpha-amylase family glycosyl hydrolase [Eubacteriales bacterium]|nr:alpha-amylase family glycosyl hydrolase [Eubacteriales bacterium]